MQAEFGFAADDQIGDMAALLELRLRPDLVGDAELLEQLVDIDAARAAAGRIDIGDRLGRQQRLLEGFDRAHVRLGRALLHHHADADAGKIDAAAGGDLALGRQVVDHGRGDHRDVESFAALDALLQAAGGVVIDDDLVAGLLLEIGHQRQHHLLEGAGGQHLDLGRGCLWQSGQADNRRR